MADAAQFERAAAPEYAIARVRPGDGRHQGFEVRRLLAGGGPLRETEVRSAEHADGAGRTGQRGGPLHRVVAVLRLGAELLPRAFRAKAPAHVLDDDDVTGARHARRVEVRAGAHKVLAVRRARQRDGIGTALMRAKD